MQIYLPGNLVRETAGVEFEDHDWELTVRELRINLQHLQGIPSLKPEQFIKVAEELINQEEELVEKLEKLSQLDNKLRKYKKFEPAETWASRWVASPIAYLFPPERREEWLGDLYEVNREMLYKGFPRWQVNFNNLVRTVILIISALQIKLSDLLSLSQSINK
ncbi:hypothetical protein A0J48_012255 [Sphaerospermopsis aphanizomenoides BCCUSP55]|uniref:hypothetical protein n=1 Tax=Sphaerospermopsis aphanizomenoides TaxID=459663 RepID=UPI00190763C3|nr:hypothetical protein [Sphaerospermopsis aphanizomenoides]MBK1988301.1 hypothetical protein [Sphaerospermopsis aphanizomenoides BCCUSP55]